MRDIDTPGYPLPCDPVTGVAWWRFNVALCLSLRNWSQWQVEKRMADIIPTLRWVIHGPIPGATS